MQLPDFQLGQLDAFQVAHEAEQRVGGIDGGEDPMGARLRNQGVGDGVFHQCKPARHVDAGEAVLLEPVQKSGTGVKGGRIVPAFREILWVDEALFGSDESQ